MIAKLFKERSKRFNINDEHFLTIMEQFTFALALSEIEAMRLSVDGKIDPSSIRMRMNETLKAVIKEGH